MPTAAPVAACVPMAPGGPYAQPAAEGSVRAVGQRVRFQPHTGDVDVGGLVWAVRADGAVEVRQDVPAGCTAKLIGVSKPEEDLEVLHGVLGMIAGAVNELQEQTKAMTGSAEPARMCEKRARARAEHPSRLSPAPPPRLAGALHEFLTKRARLDRARRRARGSGCARRPWSRT